MQGLSVSRVVDVEVNFTPQAAPTLRFDTLLILGDSTVISSSETIREYNSILEVAQDFGTTAAEYQGALLFFEQIPKPNTLFIGRWFKTAGMASTQGGVLTRNDQQMSEWTGHQSGELVIPVDGSDISLTGLNFSQCRNLNAVAHVVQEALRAAGQEDATFRWNGKQFTLEAGAAGHGQIGEIRGRMADQFKLSAKTRRGVAQAIGPESPVQAVVRLDGHGWYALTFCTASGITDPEHLAVSAYIEAASDKHIYGITSNSAGILDGPTASDIASQAMLADYMRTTIQYSSTTSYCSCSFFGRAVTTQFEGTNTTITMKFKVEPGVIPELLNATQASTLANKRCNVYAQYNNGTSIVQEGVMSGRAYFDEIHGLDWLSNRIQTDIWNVLYTSPKIPQTDPGVHILVTTCDGGLSQGVTNGLVAPGIWNAVGFGELHTGDLLTAGWYTFAMPVASQDQAIREERIAPLIQIAVKLAGAVHFADVLINVNR